MASHTPAAILTKVTGSVDVERGGTRTALAVDTAPYTSREGLCLG